MTIWRVIRLEKYAPLGAVGGWYKAHYRHAQLHKY